MNSTPQDSPSAEAKPVAFCQHCGRPLTPETVRVVGPAVFCEPCLAARLKAASSGAAYEPVNPAIPHPGTPSTPFSASGWTGASTARPHPGLAFLLGLIPGVGAMYNEQYAKGIAHLFVFALLVSLSHLGGTFGLFVFGWICYMAIEAHHTAKARRDGTPLPNPFGLNDIGERLGFDLNLHKTPPATSHAPFVASQTSAGSPVASNPVPPFAAEERGYRAPEPVATWGAPVDTPFSAAASDPASIPYTQPWSGQPAQQPASFGYPPPAPPYGSAVPPYGPHIPAPPLAATPVSRFPAGAIGLMVLGTLFLLGTTGVFHNVSGHVLTGFGLIGLGAWVFIRCFTTQNPADYRLRTFRALRSSAWLVFIGVLMLLDSLRLLRWSHSWPWILIFSGLLLLLRRILPGKGFAAPPLPPMPPMPPLVSSFPQQPGTGRDRQ